MEIKRLFSMKGSLFVYSRLEKLDYRLIFAPPKEFLAEPIRSEFIDFAREVINVDNVLNGSIEALRWSIIKRDNIVLIGIGCANSQLSSFNKDSTGRNVRGFFGVVLNSPNQNVINALCDVRFYQNLYDLFVTPLWTTTEQLKVNSIRAEINIDETKFDDCQSLDINSDNSKIKVFPQEVPFKDILFSAFRYNSVDIVYNLNNLKHITSSELYHFHNATIIGNDNTTLHRLINDFDRVDSGYNDLDHDDVGRNGFDCDDSDKYESIADRIICYFKKCGLKIELFLTILAKKCGCCVVKEPKKRDKSSSKYTRNISQVPKLQQSITKSEQIEPINCWDTEENKTARKERLKNLKEQYKQDKENSNNDQILTNRLEDIPEIDNNITNNNAVSNDLEEL